MLQKIEELSLYIIDLQKQIDELEKSKKMKSYIIAILFSTNFLANAQDLTSNKIKVSNYTSVSNYMSMNGENKKIHSKFNWQIALQVGINSGNLFSNKYTPDSLNSSGTGTSDGQQELFKFQYAPNISGEIYGIFIPKFGTHIFPEIGIGICRRSFKLKRTTESYSSIQYENLESTTNIDNVIEFPLGIGADFKYLKISLGILLPLIDITSNKSVFNDGSVQRNSGPTLSIGDHLTIRNYFKIASSFKLKNIHLGPFISIDEPLSSNPYFHIGLQILFSHS